MAVRAVVRGRDHPQLQRAAKVMADEELETLPTLARPALATVPVLNSSPWLGSFSLPGTDCTPYAEARRYSYKGGPVDAKLLGQSGLSVHVLQHGAAALRAGYR